LQLLQYAEPPLHVHVPLQSHVVPGIPGSVSHPPHALTHVSSHQLSFLSALHFHVPQQPQLAPRVWFKFPQEPHAFREEAPWHAVASVPLQA
jgi:hypothetical protein